MTRRSAGHELPTTTMTDGPLPRRRTASGGSKLAKLFRSDGPEADEITLLLNGLNEMVVTSKMTTKSADAQLRGVEALARWARRSRNCAIDDVMQRTSQLFEMYCQKQMQFARDFNHFVQQLRKIADTERRVRDYEQEVAKKEARVARLKKLISSPSSLFRKRNRAECERLRVERDFAVEELEIARRGLRVAREEAEVVKMFQFRQGMMGIADAYRNLATNCGLIFGCQREITELVPAVSTQDVNTMLYEGTPYTRERVEEVRRSLNDEFPIVYNPPAARRRSDQPRRRSSDRTFGTPPPPYTPTVRGEPPERSFSSAQPRSRFNDSHLMSSATAASRPAETFIPATPTSRFIQRPHNHEPSAPAASPAQSAAPIAATVLYPDLTSFLSQMTPK